MVLAYAAVLSLNRILEDISNSHLEQHQTPLQDQQIKSLQENLKFLLDFLDDSWQRRSEELLCMEREIRDAAYKIEDIVESHISKNFGQESLQERQIRDQTFCVNFGIVADEIDFIKTKAAITNLHHSQRTSLSTGPSRLTSGSNNAMVSFHNDLNQIMDRFDRYPPARQIIPIIGMGGIGKTTLAKNVYDHPGIAPRFDTRAWVTISQEYREREVLLSLLDSMEKLNAEMHQEDTGKLKEHLYKSLKRRRYLVVMDDVWTTDAWDSLSKNFPDDKNGSRIMMTSRLLSAVESHGFSHQLQFLDEIDSWNLLRQKVFGDDSCPSELVVAGKEIAKNCEGLPLSLVVIGGHLSKANRTKDYWEYVAQNVKSVVNATDGNYFEILSLSYDYLPPYLKACFLYMGVFPEDDEIGVSKLIKLWVAEGFLKPVRGKTFEEVAEEYLGDLISRNLIMISEKSSRGKIKTCSVHDMLRDLCLKKAQEEEFFFHVRDKDNIFAESIKYSRRLSLCIRPDILRKAFKCYQSMGSLPPVRSILSSFCSVDYCESLDELVDGKLFPLLRVLDFEQYRASFPFRETKLVHSRYIAFTYYGKLSMPKTLPYFFWYLQTLNLGCNDVYLPEEIWRMTQLRHLLIWRCYLPCPTRSPIAGENFVLGNLLTLSKVSISSCTKEVFERVPNLNKLGISSDDEKISLGILVNLSQLETLKISNFDKHVRVPINFTFPTNIKKLTLENCKIAWKHMTIVGSMPNLEVLKLLEFISSYPKEYDLKLLEFIRKREWDWDWEPTEGEFCKLKFLLLQNISLVQLRANNTNFTSLECLKLRGCSKLKEIPPSFEYIPSLRIIDLDDASSSAVNSAEQIQQGVENFGNESLQVRVKRQFKFIPLESFEYIPSLRIIDLDDASPSAVNSAEQIQQGAENFGNDSLQVRVKRQFKFIPPEELEAQLIAKLESNDDELQISACTRLSGLPRYEINPLSKGFISRIVPRLLKFIGRDDDPELQFEAVKAIEVISFGLSDNINILIEHDAIPIMASLLSSPDVGLRWRAIKVLGKIADDSAKSCDLVLSHGVLMPLLAQFNDKTDINIMIVAGQTLSYLFLRKHQFEQVKSAILPLAHLILEDDHIVSKCEPLFFLTCGEMDIKQAVVDAGVFPRLVYLLRHPESYVSSLALRIIGNIISHVNDTQIQVIIDKGALPCLCEALSRSTLPYLEGDSDSLKEATCNIISNITGRTKDHIQAVIEADIISPLLQLLQDADLFEAAAEVIYNVTTKGTNEQIKFLVQEGCIEPMCDLLVNPYEAHVIKICLEGLENILKVGEAEKNQGNTENVNVFAQMIEDAGGLQKIKNIQTHLQKIKNLQTHDDSKIRRITMKILEMYWHQEEDDDGVMMSTKDDED